jgi:toxin HigB-1
MVVMIKSFRDRETEKVFRREFSRRLPQQVQRAALRRLTYLHAAKALADLLVPSSNRLEALSGDRLGQYSIRINDQWRVCFEWLENDAYNVEIVDYH